MHSGLFLRKKTIAPFQVPICRSQSPKRKVQNCVSHFNDAELHLRGFASLTCFRKRLKSCWFLRAFALGSHSPRIPWERRSEGWLGRPMCLSTANSASRLRRLLLVHSGSASAQLCEDITAFFLCRQISSAPFSGWRVCRNTQTLCTSTGSSIQLQARPRFDGQGLANG